MKETEKNRFDKRFKDVLYDFETDTLPGDWDAIANRLPAGKSVPFRRVWRYVAAAAVVSLLVVSSAIYMYNYEQAAHPIAQHITEQLKQEEIKAIKEVTAVTREKTPIAVVSPPRVQPKTQTAVPVRATNILAADAIAEDETGTPANSKPEEPEVSSQAPVDTSPINKDVVTAVYAPKKKKGISNGWSMGMGAGNLGAGTGSTLTGFSTRSPGTTDDRLMLMNAVAAYSKPPETEINHNTPVSIGISVSKQLSNRFALQSGLTYTYLSSTWKTNGAYRTDSKQKLNYLGIPIALVYKIAEWNNFLFYASAGGMGEMNVAGKVESKLYSSNKEITKTSEKVRMKELLWSVNARVGVSYPIIRFVNAFAEGGASYYFENGSVIETVRSEKPFNASFNVGFRFGF